MAHRNTINEPRFPNSSYYSPLTTTTTTTTTKSVTIADAMIAIAVIANGHGLDLTPNWIAPKSFEGLTA